MLTWRIVMVQAHVVLKGRHVLSWVVYIKGYFWGYPAYLQYNKPQS